MNDIQDNERVLANENFWANLRDRPDYIKYEFAKSVEKLDLYLGESFKVKLNLQTSPRENNKQNHNFSEDDSGLGNFIESLYDFQNEAIKDLIDILNGVYYDLSERLESSAKYVWGILQGDFNDSPTISQVIISGLISVIPIADQVSDIRDLVANVLRLTDEGERENPENWINLALTAFGLIPMVGSVIKTLIKVIRHNEVTDIHHLTHLMETCETYLRKIGAGDYIPWKDSPIHWLQSKPWQELADRAKSKIKEYLRVFSNDLRGFGSANSVNHKNNPDYINFDKKLDDLAKIVEDISYNINQYIDKIALEVSTKVDELLSAPYAMAMVANGGKSTHTTYVNGKTPTSATHTQKSQKFTLKQMPQKRVGCFSRVNTDKAKKRAKQNIQNDHPPGSKNLTVDEYLDKETDWQLKLQQDGINSMTVEDYEKGREVFQARKASKGSGRGDGKDQRNTREKFEADLLDRYKKEYEKTMSKIEAEQKAQTTTDNVMATLDALHNPDQIVGGAKSNADMDMGLKNINSSIGRQWKNVPDDATIDLSDRERTRVGAIDEAIKAIPESERANTRMNVKLERCK